MARRPARRLQLTAGLLGSALVLDIAVPAGAQDRTFAHAVRYVHDKVVSCWNAPPGAPAGMTVRIRLELDRDGALVGQPVVLDPPSEPAAVLLVESARRAVLRCAPYDGLRRYSALHPHWREIVLNFRRPD